MGKASERAQAAINFAVGLGFSKKVANQVLRNLAKLYNNNWEMIEDENYNAFLDAIFEYQNQEKNPDQRENPVQRENPDQRDAAEEGKIRTTEAADASVHKKILRSRDVECGSSMLRDAESPKKKQRIDKDDSGKNKELMLFASSSEPLAILPSSESPVALTYRRVTRSSSRTSSQSLAHTGSPKLPKCELVTEASHEDAKENTEMPEAGPAQPSQGNDRNFTACKTVTGGSSADIFVASSSTGDIKLCLKCGLDRPNFRLPSVAAVLKRVEDKCLRSDKALPPEVSLGTLMSEICQCAEELGWQTDSNGLADDRVEDSTTLPPSKPDDAHTIEREANETEADIVAQPNSLAICHIRPAHDFTDISKAEERTRLPVANEFGSERCPEVPPSFSYIPRNIVYQNAHLNTCLARIGDEDCCPDCFGDCLSAAIPCACAKETGGEFAYTRNGLVKPQFIDECVSMNRFPEKHNKFYCQNCPLERVKSEQSPDPCKGHLIRRFIKECWCKCGCSKFCGNRIVQRGITHHLEVFQTPECKGWGLRTLEELPKGSFVCEYVGEVLTNQELYERTLKNAKNARHTYPVLLDADWGSEGVLKDEEALCLDATFYGNAARFVNHRCYDANLVEIPVEIETPDRHYYHLAFFTSRKIEALEELTWDYGIDFADSSHPIKAFQCMCGSKYCRDLKHKRTRSRGKGKAGTFGTTN